MTTFSSAASAVLVAASLLVVTSSVTLGACKTTLHGDLVQAPAHNPAYPQKFLFFRLIEITRVNGTSAEKLFQSFVVPNAGTTLPIPFALDINSPKDCPSELQLCVSTYDTDHPPEFSFGHDPLSNASKAIRLDKFQSIPVWGSSF